MSLAAAFAKVNKPVGVALIGAGKFATMFLNQVQFTPMINIVAIADLDVSRARKAVETVGWTKQAIDRTVFTTQGKEVIQMAEVEVVVEATGNPTAGVRHAMACLENGKVRTNSVIY